MGTLNVNYDIFRRRVIIVGQDMNNAQYNEEWDGNEIRGLYPDMGHPPFSVDWYANLINEYAPTGVGCHYTDIYEAIQSEMKKPIHPLDGGTVSLILIHKPNENTSIYYSDFITMINGVEEFPVIFGQLIGQEAIIDSISLQSPKIVLVGNSSSSFFYNIDLMSIDNITLAGVKLYAENYYRSNMNISCKNIFMHNIITNTSLTITADNNISVNKSIVPNLSLTAPNISLYGTAVIELSAYIYNANNIEVSIDNSTIERGTISCENANTAVLNINTSRVFAGSVTGWTQINLDDITNATTSDFNIFYPTGTALFSPSIIFKQ